MTPYALGSVQRDYSQEPSSTEWPRELGLDAKITLSPSLTLDLTANTDFAQVEVDEQRTNLTRFPLFFPEKRPFFLENAGIFSAGTPQAADLFFTRKIGITEDGTPVPVLGGGRLSGRIGGMSVGLLQIFTDDVAGEVEDNSFSVARVSRELPNRSRVGAIFVQRRATQNGDDYNRTYGLDGRWGIGDALTVDAWVAQTETPGLDGSDTGVSLFTSYTGHEWEWRVRLMRVGEDFNPEVGFVNRVGYRNFEANLMRHIRTPSVDWLREINAHITSFGWWSLEGALQTRWIHVDAELVFENGGRIGPELNIVSQGLEEPFEIAEGVVVPVGTYHNPQNGWDIATDPSATFSVVSRLEFGSFFTGSKYGGNATFTLRPNASFTTSLLVDHNIVRLPEGEFEATLLGLRIGYFFTPRIFLQSLVQYSDQADIWSANVRFAILDTASTGLYIVYNEGQRALGIGDLDGPINRGLIVKYTRQLRIF
jgi:hypothetical protein